MTGSEIQLPAASSNASGASRFRMTSRSSVINLNWGNATPSSDPASERRAASAGKGAAASRPDAQAADSARGSRHLDLDDCAHVESVTSTVEAYNEAAFRYLLDVEEKRFLRSNRRFLLLLLDVNNEAGAAEAFDPALSKKLFAALKPCVRETDFVGWYRQERVIGVVCTQLEDSQGATVLGVVAGRFQKAMRDALPERVGSRVQVRSFFLPSSGADRS
jgi:hypothetical protein